ncbi:hypothetical protein [Silvibacterium sp.]|uniref:hypothetical protein n=1 Tax=Silvibacterium sp. TaxID=1964179 RepID=UPI0039E6547E
MFFRRMLLFLACATVALPALLPTPALHAQERLTDKDIEHIMKNLHDDSKDFREAFDASIRKSSIRNTGQEKNARYLAEQFESQVDDMYKHFKGSKKADAYVGPVVQTAAQLDQLVYQLNLDSKTTLAWEKSRSELHQVATSYNTPEPYLQSTPALASTVDTQTCAASIGAVAAQKLVDRCLKVSTATHPPCNVQNSCAMMRDEIRRSCNLLGEDDAPGFCREYR